MDLSHASGRTMTYEWFDPAAGKVAATGTVMGGNSSQRFDPPSSVTTDGVLYVVDAAGHKELGGDRHAIATRFVEPRGIEPLTSSMPC